MLKVLKWLGILIVSFLILMTLLITLNTSKVKKTILNELNKNINGWVSIGTLDISVIKSFPYLGIELKDIILVDQNKDSVFKARKFTVKLNLRKLVFSKFKEIEINQLILNSPELHAYVNTTGDFNLSKIVKEKDKPATITASFTVNSKLKKVLILDGVFSHIDSSADPYSIYLDHLNTKAVGNLNAAALKLEFTNTFEHFTYISEKITYLKSVKGIWSGDFNYNLDIGDWNISNNQIALNTLKTNVNGEIKSTDGDLLFDLDVSIPENDITELISVIPGAMTNQFDKLSATGKFSFEGSVKGIMDSIIHRPMIKFKTKIDNASIKYSHLPYSLSGIHLEASVNSLDSFATKYEILLPSLRANLNGEPLEAYAAMIFNSGNLADAKGSINANLKLDEIAKIIPLENTVLGGKAFLELAFEFNESKVRQKQFDQMKLNGRLECDKISFKSTNNPELKIEKLTAIFTPKAADLIIDDGKYGHSDMDGQIQIVNPIALTTAYSDLALLSFRTTSDMIDLNEFSNYDCDTCNISGQMNETITQMDIHFNSNIKKIKYHDYDILNANLTGSFVRDSLNLGSGSAVVNGSKLSISGKLNNPYQWSFDRYPLTGNLAITSPAFNVNPYLDTATQSNTHDNLYEKKLPSNSDLTIDFSSDQALYKQFNLTKIKSKFHIRNQILNIESGVGTFSGGNISLSGIFSESDPVPAFDIKLDLNQMKVDEALKNFSSMAKIAPLASFVGGIFSTSSIFQGSLDAAMNPVWSKFDAAGVLEIINGRLANFKALEVLTDKIKIPILKNLDWEKSKNWFVIEKGIVHISPFVIPNKNMFIQLKGSHSIEQNIDYVLTTGIPKKIFDQFKVNPYLNPDFTWMREELRQKGIPIQELDTFYFETSIKGTIQDPNTMTKWVARPGGKTYSEQLKEDLENAIRQKTDSIKAAIESRAENTKDSLVDILKNEVNIKKAKFDSLKNTIEDSITKLADAKTREIIDSMVKRQTTKLLDSALQNTVDTFLNKNTKEEIDNIKEKLKNWNPLKKKKKEN